MSQHAGNGVGIGPESTRPVESLENSAAVLQSVGPPVLGYKSAGAATRIWYSDPAMWRRICLLAAAGAVVGGLLVKERIGSGVPWLNPARLLAVWVLCGAAITYVLLRVAAERSKPVWYRWVAGILVLTSLGATLVGYASWNRFRAIPKRSDAHFWPAVWVLVIAIVAFAGARLVAGLQTTREHSAPP